MSTSPRPHRPQRRLTEAEDKVVRGVKTLYLHRMLWLGLVDPVANPSPMSEDDAAWVRENVWPPFFHKIDDGYAWGFWRWSFCEKGTCRNCLAGRCDGCMHRQKGGPDVCDNRDPVHNHLGRTVATLILRPGGEPCVWWCRCPCPKEGEAPARRPRKQQPADASRTSTGGGRRRGQESLPGL